MKNKFNKSIRKSIRDMVKQPTPEDKFCFRCKYMVWWPRKHGPYGYCIKHDNWFRAGKKLSEITCKDWIW